MLPYFDLHNDTLEVAYDKGTSIYDNSLYASLGMLDNISPYIQVASIWSDYHLVDDEAFYKALNVISFAKNQNIKIITSLNCDKKSYILGIEDARLLNNDLSRLDLLYSLGIRVLTLNWKDDSCIGGGWNTNNGLTDFGKSVIKRCSELGIIVDLSHSSEESFKDTLALSDKLGFSPIASHSNSFTIYNHKRNLTDFQIKELIKRNSVIGVSLVGEHLSVSPCIDSVISHIEHILRLGGENSVCLGCDFDGTDNLPKSISSIKDVEKLYSRFSYYFGEYLSKRILFLNAFEYFKNNLKGD